MHNKKNGILMRFLFLILVDDVGNALLCLGKGHPHIIFACKPAPFLCFDVHQFQKCMLAQILVLNGTRISWAILAMRGYPSIWRHQNVESIAVPKSC